MCITVDFMMVYDLSVLIRCITPFMSEVYDRLLKYGV